LGANWGQSGGKVGAVLYSDMKKSSIYLKYMLQPIVAIQFFHFLRIFGFEN
jgi:hypothetical protein